DVLDVSENGREDDVGWSSEVTVIIEPDPRLKPDQKAIVAQDYGMQQEQLLIPSRGALVQYVLQRYQIDPNKIQAKAAAQQIVVANLEELQQWIYQ
ncbi:TPA: WYL domain-containing protein, partial [Pseudomonas aeruginosa]|nr:WYL domain-containing protein [Pseudomonas aeruginosa]HCL3894772.1 WYL domain-containing protein [Pseudomonas aeruginosa]